MGIGQVSDKKFGKYGGNRLGYGRLPAKAGLGYIKKIFSSIGRPMFKKNVER